MTAWWRWVLSAAMVSSTSSSAVVKNAWEAPGVEQSVLAGCRVSLGVEIGDPAHHQPPRHVVGLFLCSERDERYFRDFRAGDPPPGRFILDPPTVFCV